MSVLSQTVSYLLLLAGGFLVIAEAFIPGAHFIVVGVSLLLTGIVSLIAPFGGIPILVVTFIASSLLTLYGYHQLDIYGTSQGQTSDSDSLMYANGIVLERVTDDSGLVKITSGSTGFSDKFQARCFNEPIPEGTEITVTDSQGGSILEVREKDEDMSRINRELNSETEKELN